MKAYKYRIYPTNEQKIFFAKTFGCVRKVYNLMLSERIKKYEEEKQTGIKSKYPTPAKYKEEYPYLKEIDSLALANAQLNLQSSYGHFFRRLRENKGQLGFPKYKNKHHKQSYTTNNQNGTVKIVDDCWLKLPKFKTLIKIKRHRNFQGVIKSVTISKTPTEKYYASILVEQTKDMSVFETKNQEVLGIDLGLSHFAILSNGEKINNPKFLDNSLKLLEKEQRKLSRRKKGSVNRNKQRLIVAKAHEKISNKRNDFLHKVSTKIVNENQVTILAVENLNVKGMTKNKRLARHINDCGWGRFIELLNYKAKEKNSKIQKVDRFFPSSKTCHCCGYKLEKLSLSIRSWKCPSCHTTHDRDINAAINLKNKIKADVFGTKMYVKSSSETILHSSSVSAKGISLKY